MKFLVHIALASAALISAAPAMAATVNVNSVALTPTATNWGTKAGENTGGGKSVVTNTVARSGNGSLEIFGDRTRAQLGLAPALFTTSTKLGALSDVSSLTFDWRISGNSVSALSPFLTPALRLLFTDGSGKSGELVWEGAYNGTYNNTSFDTWYSTSANDLFYFGRGNENAGKTIADWASSLTGATVNGYSVGVGSSAGTGYHAFVDNVAFTKGGVTTNYNFETAAIPGAVPEPASWLMMILGFGLAGVGMRRCVRSSNGEFETKMKKAYAAI